MRFLSWITSLSALVTLAGCASLAVQPCDTIADRDGKYFGRFFLGVATLGLSEVTTEQIARAREIVPIAAVQNHYNLAERAGDDVVDLCEREGIAFVPFFPLRGEGGPGVAAAAERLGVTENAVKLAWLLRRSPVVLPIPGTRSIEHLRENLAALELDLGDADDIAA